MLANLHHHSATLSGLTTELHTLTYKNQLPALASECHGHGVVGERRVENKLRELKQPLWSKTQNYRM